MVESESADGPSALTELYAKPEFIRGWHNDASFHVAQNALYLRKYRGLTQSDLAKKMDTSQSAIARIEGGDENITLSTLKRLVTNLRGRLSISFPPEELSLPRLPVWWEIRRDASGAPWTLNVIIWGQNASGRHLLFGLTQPNTLPLADLVVLDEAS